MAKSTESSTKQAAQASATKQLTATADAPAVAAPASLQRAFVDPRQLQPADVQNLQRAIGNQATGDLLRARLQPGVTKPSADIALPPVTTLASVQRALAIHTTPQQSSSRPIQPTVNHQARSRFLQTQLILGPAGDQYEQEADRTAQQVVQSLDAPIGNLQRSAEQGGNADSNAVRTHAGGKADALTLQRTIDNRALAPPARPVLQTRQASVQKSRLVLDPVDEMVEGEGEAMAMTEQVMHQMDAPPPPQPPPPGAPGMPNLNGGASHVGRMTTVAHSAPPPALVIPAPRTPNGAFVAQRKKDDGGDTTLSAAPALQMRMPAAPHHILRTFQIQRDEEGKLLHGPQGGVVAPQVQQQIQQERGGGSPLTESVRRRMEQGFGSDFGNVRVHADTQADTLNRSLNARAFTVGSDVFFKRGAYDPGSRSGLTLLAHELTHTVQQGAAPALQREVDESSITSSSHKERAGVEISKALAGMRTRQIREGERAKGNVPISKESKEKAQKALAKLMPKMLATQEAMLKVAKSVPKEVGYTEGLNLMVTAFQPLHAPFAIPVKMVTGKDESPEILEREPKPRSSIRKTGSSQKPLWSKSSGLASIKFSLMSEFTPFLPYREESPLQIEEDDLPPLEEEDDLPPLEEEDILPPLEEERELLEDLDEGSPLEKEVRHLPEEIEEPPSPSGEPVVDEEPVDPQLAKLLHKKWEEGLVSDDVFTDPGVRKLALKSLKQELHPPKQKESLSGSGGQLALGSSLPPYPPLFMPRGLYSGLGPHFLPGKGFGRHNPGLMGMMMGSGWMAPPESGEKSLEKSGEKPAPVLRPTFVRKDFTLPAASQDSAVVIESSQFDTVTYDVDKRRLSANGKATLAGSTKLGKLKVPLVHPTLWVENNRLKGEAPIASLEFRLPSQGDKSLVEGFLAGDLIIEDGQLKGRLIGDADFEVPGIGHANGVYMEAIYGGKEGLTVQAHLKQEIQVGNLMTLETLEARYAGNEFRLEGMVHVTGLAGTKPFRAPVIYVHGKGLTIDASRIDLDLPEVAGIQPTGTLENLHYSSDKKSFSGEGHLQAELPFLGAANADVNIKNNKLEKTTLKFAKNDIAFPNPPARPLISGKHQGNIVFDGTQFQSSEFGADLLIDIPGKEGVSKTGDLKLKAQLIGQQFKGSIELVNRIPVHDAVEIGELHLTFENERLGGGGSFQVSKLKDTKTRIPFKMDAGGVKSGGQADQEFGVAQKSQVWGKLNYGFDLVPPRFRARGNVNVLLPNGAILSGQLSYNTQENKFAALAEVGNAPLIKQRTFKKTLFDQHKKVTLHRFGALGGIYGEGGAKLDFDFTVGPVMLDADAQLTNIDLWNETADAEEVNIELEGGVQATLHGAPYLGLGTWFADEALAHAKGGLKIPVTACMKAEPKAKLEGMAYKSGKITGPDASLKVPLIFQLKADLTPYAHLYALKGLVDTGEINFAPLASFNLVKPRKILDVGINLNQGKEKEQEAKPASDLATAPEATSEDARAEIADCVPVVTEPPAQQESAKADPGSETLGLAGPIDLEEAVAGLRERIEGNAWYAAAQAMLQGIKNVQEKLGWSIDAIMTWLEEKGLMAKLKGAQEKLKAFGEAITKASSSSYALLVEAARLVFGESWDAEAVASDEIPEPESGGEEREEHRLFVIELGPSDIQVVAPVVAGGTGTQKQFKKNRLEKDGLKLKQANLNFTEQSTLKSGELIADVDIGVWGVLRDVKLELSPKESADNVAIASTSFATAGLEASEKLKEQMFGSMPETVDGILENTQTRLIKVGLGQTGKLKLPSPLGGEELVSQNSEKIGFEKTLKEWLLSSRAVNVPFSGGSLTAELLEMMVSPAGVSGKGRLTLLVDSVGKAEADLAISEGAFESMELRFRSNEVKIPSEQPFVIGHVAGGLKVAKGGGISEPKVALNVQAQHAQLNDGKPVPLQAALDFTGFSLDKNKKSMPKFTAGLRPGKEGVEPVALIKDVLTVTKLEMARDEKGNFSAAGEARLPGLEAGLALDYKDGGFKLTVQKALTFPWGTLHQFSAGAEKGVWTLGADATINSIAGFGEIRASMSYAAHKLIFNVTKAEPPQIPGISAQVMIGYLGYDTKTGDFEGAGMLKTNLPVVGAASAELRIANSELQEAKLHMESTEQINLPSAEAPLISGNYKGDLLYKQQKLQGELKGDLAFGAPGIKAEEKPKLDFLLKGGDVLEGSIKQREGEGRINRFLQLKNFNLTLAQQRKVTPQFVGLMGGVAATAYHKGSVRDPQKAFAIALALMMPHFAKLNPVVESKLNGGADLALDLGKGKGGIKLKVTDNEFSFEEGQIEIGTKEDRIHGKGAASYSVKEGLSFRTKVDARLGEGMKASGAIEYGQKKDPEAEREGLNAALKIEQPVWDGTEFDKELVPERSMSATFFALGPIFFYGKAGIQLGFVFKVEPLSVVGTAAVRGLDLNEMSYEQILASIELKGGKVSAALQGKPSLGLGAKLISEAVASVEGGVKIPITAGAFMEPKLKTSLLFDKSGDVKGNARINLPLAFGIYAEVTPYMNATLLTFPIVKGEMKPLEKGYLMTPRVVMNIPINFGKLDEASTQKFDSLTADEDKMPPAPAKPEVKSQEDKEPVVSETKIKEKPPESPPKDGEAPGPFDFNRLWTKLKAPFEPLGRKAKAVWDGVVKTAKMVGQAAKYAVTATAGALKNTAQVGIKVASNAGKFAVKAITNPKEAYTLISKWMWSQHPSDPERAAEEVEGRLKDPQKSAEMLENLGGASLMQYYPESLYRWYTESSTTGKLGLVLAAGAAFAIGGAPLLIVGGGLAALAYKWFGWSETPTPQSGPLKNQSKLPKTKQPLSSYRFGGLGDDL